MNIHSEVLKQLQALQEEMETEVSVALFGRPSSGKSSLINLLAGQPLAEVGIEPGITIEERSYPINGLRFVDLPGYDTADFPKESFLEKFPIDTYDVFLCVTSGAFTDSETGFYRELEGRGKPIILVVNKHDELWEVGVSIEELERRKVADLHKQLGAEVSVTFTSCKSMKGLDELSSRISESLEDARSTRWAQSARAFSQEFLEKKRAACEKRVTLASLIAAANGVNPAPGLDVAIDIGVIVDLFSMIRQSYGIDGAALHKLKTSPNPLVMRYANSIAQHVTKAGVLLLLRKYAGRQAVKQFAKYIPIAGQVVAAGVGYAITSNAGKSYLDECHQLANALLEKELGS